MELCFEAPDAKAGQRITLSGAAILGRAPDCGVQIQDRRVSRHHARVFLERGQWVLQDLDSPNGTVLNGVRVARHELGHGDVLMVGPYRLRVHMPDSAKPVVPNLWGKVIKPVSVDDIPTLDSLGKDTFFQSLGLGDNTLLDIRAPGELLQKTRQFAVLHELSRTLRESHHPREMLAEVLDGVLNVLEGERAFVALSDDEGSREDSSHTSRDDFQVDIYRCRSSDKVQDLPQLSTTVVEYVLSQRCAVLSRDLGDDDRFAASESLFLSPTQAFMAVPILLRDRLLGAMVVESETIDRFSEPDLDLLTLIAFMVGQTLENLRLAERREETIQKLKEAQASLLCTQAQLVRSEQLAIVGRLASGLAHEVNNHLSPFALADMIARKYPDDKETQAAVEMMLEARQHIVDLVSEVKGFARGAQSVAERRQPTDMADLCRAVVRFTQIDTGVKRHEMRIVVNEDTWAEVDPGRIRQVLVNLIKNAADALGETPGRIILTVDEEDGWSTIEVQDNGPGISSTIGDRVFEPFFSTKGGNGLGLGLDIARAIVRAHGGELTYRSPTGLGTVFRLCLSALASVS
ncbi:MAG: FHA domain-containing protein [Myxococcales bacterium]|nr:FHA domain-containing protein [Myxococcales bacterium]